MCTRVDRFRRTAPPSSPIRSPASTSSAPRATGGAPTFLLATGYEQVRSVVAELAGDRAAADAVQLILPETGVCSTDRSPAAVAVIVPVELRSDLVTALDAQACCR
jgi:hypothetical protein